MLTGFIKTPCEVVFKNFDKKENDYNERNIMLILNYFKDAETEYPTKFKVIFNKGLDIKYLVEIKNR